MNPLITNKIQQEPIDLAILGISTFGILLSFIIPAYHYSNLPDLIPTHYGIIGIADDFGANWTIWLLPIISLVLTLSLYYLSKYPHKFNYPYKITEENKTGHYKNAQRLVLGLNLTQLFVFLYINYTTVTIAQNKTTGLGSQFLPIFLILFLLVPVYFLFQMSKVKAK